MKKWCKYLILLFALTFVLASCGQVEEPPYVPPVIDDECSEHVDLNEDLVCDICGEKLKGQSQEDETEKRLSAIEKQLASIISALGGKKNDDQSNGEWN